jgi:dTDP-4-amino-4,6-dideoxygalactose transaminase
MKIPIYKPELPPYEEVEPDIKDMYLSGMLYPSKYTVRLEKQVKEYYGVPYVIPVTSCSTGLILLLNSLWPKKGKVILPSFTFNSTLQAVEWNSLTPVVVDVDDDGQMRPDLVEDALNQHPDVIAIMPVHMWGNACYPEEYEKLRSMTNIPVFFDGAHVFGTTYEGQSLSQFGSGIVNSIAATKPVSAGEGGLVITRFESIAEAVKEGASHGLVGSLDTRSRGMNGKIQEFNSILAYHAINHFEKTKKRRADIMEMYRDDLFDSPVRVWETRPSVDATYKDCVIFTQSPAERNRLETYLNEKGIGTKRYFDPAIPDMGSFNGIVHSADNGRRLANICLTLPLYPSLTNKEVAYVTSSIDNFFKRG